MVEFKNPERKGSRLPLWHMEDSDSGEDPACTSGTVSLSAKGHVMLLFISDFWRSKFGNTLVNREYILLSESK